MRSTLAAILLVFVALSPLSARAEAPAAQTVAHSAAAQPAPRVRTALKVDLDNGHAHIRGGVQGADGTWRGRQHRIATQATDDGTTEAARKTFAQVGQRIREHEHFAHSSEALIKAALDGAVTKAPTARTLSEIYAAATDAMVGELKKADRWARIETKQEFEERSTPAVNNVTSHRLPGDLVIVKMQRFRGPVALQVRAAIAEAKKRGPVEGVILDLRGNGGGSVKEAHELVSQWLPTGQALITTEYGPLGAPNSVEVMKAIAPPQMVDTRTPIVVLVNGRSASASELSTGILKDLGRVTIIGEKTFGKGVGQQSVDMPDGRVFTQTQWRRKLAGLGYYHGVGLSPDVDAAAAKANVAAAAQAGKLRDRGDAVLRSAILHLWSQRPASNDNAAPAVAAAAR